MRKPVLSALLTIAIAASGCQASGGASGGDKFSVYENKDGTAGVYYVPVQGTSYILAPMALETSYAPKLDLSLSSGSAYGGDRDPALPRSDGWASLGSGPWFNAAVFDSKTGQSKLLLDRRAIVWHTARATADAKGFLLLVTDKDDNNDGKLGGDDFNVLYYYEFETGALRRVTPEHTTVVGASSPAAAQEKAKLDLNQTAPPPAEPQSNTKPTLFLTLRVDRNKNGKIERDEPPMIQMLGSFNTPPVLSADQFEAARKLWQQPQPKP